MKKALDSPCANKLSDAETACSRSDGADGLEFSPIEYKQISKYEKVSMIYELPLSPSVITLTTCSDSSEVSYRHLF